jgi:hypothetical protein
VENGVKIDVTNSPYTSIGTSNPNRLSLSYGDVSIHPVPSGELLSPEDFVLGTILIFYGDEAGNEYGALSIHLKIR